MRLPAKKIALLSGPIACFLIIWQFHPASMPDAAVAALGCIVWIAIWWVTEAIPIAATSILPFILFPVLGVMPIKEVAVNYSKPIIFIFVGGFMIALAMEKWNLHRRIALSIINLVGTNLQQIVLGFVLATGLSSMWISNTATTVMMLPIGLAMIQQIQSIVRARGIELKGIDEFGKVIVLAIAYSASIGGIATLVGTPTNLVFIDYARENYTTELSFARWFAYGFPMAIILLIVCWLHLVHNAFKLGSGRIPGSKKIISEQLTALGKIKSEERWILLVFACVAVAWIGRKYLISPWLPAVDDTVIALTGALILFLIPSKSTPGESVMDWKTALKLPWGVLWLFGGAFALADAFGASGLNGWIGLQLNSLTDIPFFWLLLIIVSLVIFVTELAQNMATCTLMLPILGGLAPEIGTHPYSLMVPMCVAASCAFMLPVATAPNAIVIGSGHISIRDMARAGFLLNILSIIVVVAFSYYLLPYLWGL